MCPWSAIIKHGFVQRLYTVTVSELSTIVLYLAETPQSVLACMQSVSRFFAFDHKPSLKMSFTSYQNSPVPVNNEDFSLKEKSKSLPRLTKYF